MVFILKNNSMKMTVLPNKKRKTVNLRKREEMSKRSRILKVSIQSKLKLKITSLKKKLIVSKENMMPKNAKDSKK